MCFFIIFVFPSQGHSWTTGGCCCVTIHWQCLRSTAASQFPGRRHELGRGALLGSLASAMGTAVATLQQWSWIFTFVLMNAAAPQCVMVTALHGQKLYRCYSQAVPLSVRENLVSKISMVERNCVQHRD